MSRYKRYERYKDSGVKWIGEIPEHWGVSKLKYLTYCLDGKRIPLSSEQRGEMQGDIPYWGANCIIDYVNDWLIDGEVVLLGEDGAPFFDKYKDVAFYSNGRIWPNNHVHVLRALQSINAKLLTYILNTVDYSNYIKGSTRDKLTQAEMKNIFIQLLPVREQKAIVNFLDQKTAEIDALIADKEKLIQLLQEKRQAIITEAVTKGLNPNVKMKDSGIEWIGEIPEHWEVKKLKYVSNITMGQSPKSEECSYDEIGVPFLQGNAEFTNVHPIPKLYCNTANKFSKVNDILLSVRAPVGAMNISDRVYGIGRGLCAITAKKIQVKYLWYSLTVSLEELFIKSKGSTFEAVTVTDVQNLLIILPPKNEQDAIVNFLDQKTAEIDDLITEIKLQIQKLKEYRQSLISEAVTNKIDVREFQE
jgi:type I restriction enzyme S subunit